MWMGHTQIQLVHTKWHEFIDSLQKPAKKAFGTEAQQFIDKTKYAKMPGHVKNYSTAHA